MGLSHSVVLFIGGVVKKKKSESKVQVMYDDDDVCMYLDTAFPSVTGQL